MKTDLEIFSGFGKKTKEAERLGGSNCIIYTRVSTKEQEDGYSLETQKKEIEKHCEKNALNVVGYFGGVFESAKTDERDEFSRMLKFARKSKEKVSYILVYSVDRFSRSGANAIFIASELRKDNIKIFAVTQPSDTSTASGKFQQNIQFIFSEYDNDLRREKCSAGMKEMLMQGHWCTRVPIGYSQSWENKEQKIFVNEKGKILKKAFYWKAENIYTNVEIRNKLKTLGVSVNKQQLTRMFSNPFYCGILSHNMLNGEVVEGKHEKLISKELFLQINNLKSRNPKGKHAKEFNDIPLKHFIKCGDCGTPFSGYLVRKKNIWYYKCNKVGCKCNRNADTLNNKFVDYLSSMQLNGRYIAPVMDEILSFVNVSNTSEIAEHERQLKTQLAELNKKIEKVEEKFILEEIEKELYTKYISKYREERAKIHEEMSTLSVDLSNLDRALNKYCMMLSNLTTLWASSDFKAKVELQNLIFPEGILYDRKIEGYRTNKKDFVIDVIDELTGDSGNKKSGLSSILLNKSALVAGE